MATETRYIVKVYPYADITSPVYWLAESKGVCRDKEAAYKYSADELKNHSKAHTITCKLNVVLVPVQVKVED